jgi:hypothetical protein
VQRHIDVRDDLREQGNDRIEQPISCEYEVQRLPFDGAAVAFGNQIYAARMKRMTAAEARDHKPRTAHGSVFLDRFERILRATGIKTATRADQGRDRPLVELDKKNERATHARLYQGSFEFVTQLREGRSRGSGTGDDQQAQFAARKQLMQKRRHAAAHFIANDGFADRLSYGNTDHRGPVRMKRLGSVDRQGAGRIAPATLAQARKLALPPQAGIPAHQTVRR